MIIRKTDRVLEVDEANEKIYDYDLRPLSVGLSYQELNGRVPQTGSTRNKECEECYYVLEGTVKVFVDNQEYLANPGDVVVVPKGSLSYVATEGAKLLTFTNPDWYADQNESVNK